MAHDVSVSHVTDSPLLTPVSRIIMAWNNEFEAIEWEPLVPLTGIVVTCLTISYYVAHKLEGWKGEGSGGGLEGYESGSGASRGEKKNMWGRADLVYSLGFIPWLMWHCIHGLVWEEGEYRWTSLPPQTERWTRTSDSSLAFLRVYLVSTFVHIGVVFLKDVKSTMRVQLLLHHAVSLTGYAMALSSGTMHWFGMAAGVCEINAFFLTIVMLLKDLRQDSNLLFLASGTLLFITQFLLRLALFSWILYTFVSDLWLAPSPVDLHALGVPRVQAWFGFITMTVLLLLSTMWTIPITKGFAKSIGLVSTTTKDATRKKDQ